MGTTLVDQVTSMARRGAASARYRGRKAAEQAPGSLVQARTHLPAGSGVALTFDDGPHPEVTPALLDVLAELGATATFFCLGKQAEAHPELLARMVTEGHSVGSHSHTHRETWTLGPLELVRDLRRGHRAVEEALGRSTRLFRPPEGHVNLSLAVAARLNRFHTWLWSVDPKDWKGDCTVEDVVGACSPLGDGDVVLLHDHPGSPDRISQGSVTIESAAEIIESVRALGLQVARLPM